MRGSFEIRRHSCRDHGPISIADGQGTGGLHADVTRKVQAIVGSAVFPVIAPGFTAGLVPWRTSAFPGISLSRFAGAMPMR